MAIAAQLFVGGRGYERAEVSLDGTLRRDSWQPMNVGIEDVSISGFRARTSVKLKVGDPVSIGIAGLGVRGAYVVRTKPGILACRFSRTLPPDFLARITGPAAVTLVTVPFPSSNAAPIGTAKYPVRARLVIIIGLALASWGAIAGAISAILKL